MDSDYFALHLYPLQEEVLQLISGIETGFYLGGGTAASRGYLHHRYSEDLDLFVNDSPLFKLWCDRLIFTLSRMKYKCCEVVLREDRFCRLWINKEEVALKIECINDVPSHVGEISVHPTLGRLDSAENLLANKVTALMDREEPRDLADIWGFCIHGNLSLSEAITNASGKAAGIFPPDLARRLLSATPCDWSLIRWINAPKMENYLEELRKLGESLLLCEMVR